ncbi:MAG: peptidoglycan-binding domain-containing protein [Hyphomicrobiales bacterium]
MQVKRMMKDVLDDEGPVISSRGLFILILVGVFALAITCNAVMTQQDLRPAVSLGGRRISATRAVPGRQSLKLDAAGLESRILSIMPDKLDTLQQNRLLGDKNGKSDRLIGQHIEAAMRSEGDVGYGGKGWNIRMVQIGLAELGYDPGPVDGLLGRKTHRAICEFQRERAMPITGEISGELIGELAKVSGQSALLNALNEGL